MNILIIAHPRQGKTTAALTLTELMKEANIPYGGVLCQGNNITYLQTDNTEQFLYTHEINDATKPGKKYWIPLQEIERGKQEIINSAKQERYTFIDEYGHLEVRGEGFAPAIKESLSHHKTIILMRKSNIKEFNRQYSGFECKEFELTKENRNTIPQEVFEFIKAES